MRIVFPIGFTVIQQGPGQRAHDDGGIPVVTHGLDGSNQQPVIARAVKDAVQIALNAQSPAGSGLQLRYKAKFGMAQHQQ